MTTETLYRCDFICVCAVAGFTVIYGRGGEVGPDDLWVTIERPHDNCIDDNHYDSEAEAKAAFRTMVETLAFATGAHPVVSGDDPDAGDYPPADLAHLFA